MTLWAIAYTLDNRGRPRKTPCIFSDTVSFTRREAWERWSLVHTIYGKTLRRKWGAKAIKVRLELAEREGTKR